MYSPPRSNQVEAPVWFRPEMRRIAKLYNAGILDATTFNMQKRRILNECFEAKLAPHISTPSRSVSPKKMKKYIQRLHSSASRRTLHFEATSPAQPQQQPPPQPRIQQPALLAYKKVWKPTGAIVFREHPEEKALPTASLLQQQHGTPQRYKKMTIASTVRMQQLSQPKPHPWFSAPSKKRSHSRSSYTSLPVQHYYSMVNRNTTVTASPWPLLRRQQEDNGLSVTSTSASIGKITHPILLYKAQKGYTERIDTHLDMTDLGKVFTQRKLPPLDNSHSVPEYVRY